jgi:hypothetical protein
MCVYCTAGWYTYGCCMAGIWCYYILFPLVWYDWVCLGMYVCLFVYLYCPTHCGRL